MAWPVASPEKGGATVEIGLKKIFVKMFGI